MSKKTELTAAQRFAIEEQAFEQANKEYLANAGEPCKLCGGRKGYNPVTGIELKKGHRASCLTLADKRAMVTTYNTSY